MTQTDISQAKDPALRAAMAALLRAGVQARKTALDTATDLIFVKDGQIVRVQVKDYKAQPDHSPSP